MKIILLGEFSSLHKYLKDGLQELGVETILAANGDGWKKIGGADVYIPEFRSGSLLNRFNFYITFLKVMRKIKGFDVVQVINPNIFPAFIWDKAVNLLKKQNKMLSLAVAGDNYTLLQMYNTESFEYYVFDYDKTNVNIYDKKTISGKSRIRRDLKLERIADVIIPSLYEYSIGYNRNVNTVIPFPINISEIKYKENVVKDKVVFFHGLNREAAKGTAFIKEALEKLKNKYPSEVEVIIDGHMPMDKYLKVLEKTNVVVDQCCSYGYGINACIAMAQGKIVMSGCRKETLGAFGINTTPMVCTKPDAEYLYKEMVKIVENKKEIPRRGLESRQYVERLHDYRKVAKLYLKAWQSTGKSED